MNLIKILTDIGFSKKEADIYIALLELGETAPSIIAKKTDIKRPTVYITLENLKKRGIVSHKKKKNALYYSAINPKVLLEDQNRRVKNLEKTIPKLLTLKDRYNISPQISIFEGEEGVIHVMEDSLTSTDEILCWSSAGRALKEDYFKEYHSQYVKKKNKKNIFIRGLFLYEKKGLQFKKLSEKEKREIYLIPKEKFNFENEINIYNDKLSIISYKDKMGVIIQNAAIADTQRSIFNFAFEYAKMLEKDILTDEDRAYLNNK